jgi:hypothetical protein
MSSTYYPEQCPLCCGKASFLGRLGRKLWYKCRSCGIEYTAKEDTCANETNARPTV